MAGLGHEDLFPPYRSNARCPFSQGTLAETHGKRARRADSGRSREHHRPAQVDPKATFSNLVRGAIPRFKPAFDGKGRSLLVTQAHG